MKHTGNAGRMYDLSTALKKRGVKAISHEKNTTEWWRWHAWRKRNGFSNTYMESQPKYSFPSDMPPESGYDTALAEATAGTSSKKFAT